MGCQIDAADGVADSTYFDFGHEFRKAKKIHKCCECEGEIQPGESYRYDKGKFDGDFFTEKTCALCAEIRSKLFCTWIFGEMWECLAQESVFTLSLADLSEAAIDELNEFWKSNQ